MAGKGRGRDARRIREAGLAPDAIDVLLLTGGSTRLSNARAAVAAAVPPARIAKRDTFGSVVAGLAVDAGRRYVDS